jgi:hypothetical protein
MNHAEIKQCRLIGRKLKRMVNEGSTDTHHLHDMKVCLALLEQLIKGEIVEIPILR